MVDGPDRILHSSGKEWPAATLYNMDNYVEQKRLDIKEYILCDSVVLICCYRTDKTNLS